MRICELWLCLALMLLAAMSSVADESTPANKELPANELSTFSIYVDNDLFLNTDRYYTHGTRLAVMTRDRAPEELGWPAEFVHSLLPQGGGRTWRDSLGFALGQHIYTPEQVDTPAFVPGDHPYAGYAYVAGSLHHRSATSLHIVELTLGWVGPGTLAEEGQKLVHEIRDIEVPEGWEYQLNSAFAGMLAYEYRQRLAASLGELGWEVDLVPRLGVRLGNYRTEAMAGATLRFGYQIPDDFHNSRIDKMGYGHRPHDHQTALGIYAFAGVLGRGVATDIILDEDFNRLKLEPWVGHLEAGVGLRLHNVHVLYSHIYSSSRYRQQANGHRYGNITLTVTF